MADTVPVSTHRLTDMDHAIDDLYGFSSLSSPEPSLPAAPSFPSLNIRKRPFLPSRGPSQYDAQLADALNTSSDPALFSSDETPDAENYSNSAKRRKKKTYKGAWWDAELMKSRVTAGELHDGDPAVKRRFRRNFDSGIFMADESSGTELSSDGLLDQELITPLEKNRKEEATGAPLLVPGSAKKIKIHHTFKFATQSALDRLPSGRPIKPKDHLIRKVVQDCLDTNNEMVDWTGMGLDYLPPAITDLKSMIKRINSDAIDTTLAPFEAQLKIFLGNNNLTQLPPSLLELTNVELLSVRQNSIVEIPPGVRALKCLKSLNISANNVQYLPYEVIDLFRFGTLTELNESPNPWMMPPAEDARSINVPPLAILVGGAAAGQTTFLRRHIVGTAVEFLSDGSSRKLRNSTSPASKQPHLTEMVLRALSRHNTSRANLSSLLSDDHPPPVRQLLETLHSVQTYGGRSCTFCHCDMVLPRYQWYEWWDIVENMKPDWDVSRFNIQNNVPVRGDGSRVEIFINEADLETIGRGPKVCKEEELIPFERMACGCLDMITGLQEEAEKIKQNGVTIELVES